MKIRKTAKVRILSSVLAAVMTVWTLPFNVLTLAAEDNVSAVTESVSETQIVTSAENSDAAENTESSATAAETEENTAVPETGSETVVPETGSETAVPEDVSSENTDTSADGAEDVTTGTTVPTGFADSEEGTSSSVVGNLVGAVPVLMEDTDKITVTNLMLSVNYRPIYWATEVKNGDFVAFAFRWEIDKTEGNMPQTQTMNFDLYGIKFADGTGPLLSNGVAVGTYTISGSTVTFEFTDEALKEKSFITGTCNIQGQINYGSEDISESGNIEVGEKLYFNNTVSVPAVVTGEANVGKSASGNAYKGADGYYYQDYTVSINSSGLGPVTIQSLSDVFDGSKMSLSGNITASSTGTVKNLSASYSDFSSIAGVVMSSGSNVTLNYTMKLDANVMKSEASDYANKVNLSVKRPDGTELEYEASANPNIVKSGNLEKYGALSADKSQIEWTVKVSSGNFTSDHAANASSVTNITDVVEVGGVQTPVSIAAADIINEANWDGSAYVYKYTTDVSKGYTDREFKNKITLDIDNATYSKETSVWVSSENLVDKNSSGTVDKNTGEMNWTVTFTVPENATSLVLKDTTSGKSHAVDESSVSVSGASDYTVSGGNITFNTIPAGGTVVTVTYKTKTALGNLAQSADFGNTAELAFTVDGKDYTNSDTAWHNWTIGNHIDKTASGTLNKTTGEMDWTVVITVPDNADTLTLKDAVYGKNHTFVDGSLTVTGASDYTASGADIVFNTVPAAGSVITVKYKTKANAGTLASSGDFGNTASMYYEIDGTEYNNSDSDKYTITVDNPVDKTASGTFNKTTGEMDWTVKVTAPADLASLNIKDSTSGMEHSFVEDSLTVTGSGITSSDYSVDASGNVTFTNFPAADTEIVVTYKTKASADALSTGGTFSNTATVEFQVTGDPYNTYTYTDTDSYTTDGVDINAVTKNVCWYYEGMDINVSNRLAWTITVDPAQFKGYALKAGDKFELKDTLTASNGLEVVLGKVAKVENSEYYSVAIDKSIPGFEVTVLQDVPSDKKLTFHYTYDFKDIEEFVNSSNSLYSNSVEGKYYPNDGSESFSIGGGTASQWKEGSSVDLIDKTCAYQSGNIAEYKIEVNKDELQLSAEGDWVDVIDTMGDLLLINKNSISIEDKNGNSVGSYSIDGQTVTFTVPDKTYCIIEYQVGLNIVIPESGISKDDLTVEQIEGLSNSVIIKGRSSNLSQSNTQWNTSLLQSGATVDAIYAQLEISKYDTNDINILLNATFKLEPGEFDSDTDEFTVFTGSGYSTITDTLTDIDKFIDKLQFNVVYRLSEVTPPAGYSLDDTMQYIVMRKVGTKEPTIYKPDNVVITYIYTEVGDKIYIANTQNSTDFNKYDENNAHLAEAEIEIAASSAVDLSKVKVEGAKADSVTVNGTSIMYTTGTGTVTVKGLPAGTYTMSEITAPTGYELADEITFTVDNYGKIKVGGVEKTSVDMINVKANTTVDVVISKTDIAGVEIEGAKLEITDSSDKVVDSWTSTATPHEVKLQPGTYTLTETTAPEGYVVTESITFKVDAEGNISIKQGDSSYVDADSSVITMVDGYADQEVVISKTNIAGAEIEGAKLEITDSTDTVIDSWTSTATPHTTTLQPGTYTLTETLAPTGYDIAESITFTVDEKGVVTVNGTDVNGKVTMVDGYKTHEAEISKQDLIGNELAGAVITITGTDVDGNKVDFVKTEVTGGASKVTRATSSLTFTSGDTSTVIKKLPAGTYTITEVTAPIGYKTTTEIEFTVGMDGKITVGNETVSSVVMKDEPIIINISKEDAGANELAGAVITVTGKDSKGNAVDFTNVDVKGGAKDISKNGTTLEFTSGDTAAVIEKIPAGTYTMHEDTAPLGYTVATDITFTVNEDGTVTVDGVTSDTVTMTDKPVSVKLSKKTAGGEELAGAVITVTGKDSNGNAVDFAKVDVSNVTPSVQNSTKLTFTSNGTAAELSKLPAGTYTMTEDTAPLGYSVATSITFTVTADGSVYVDGVKTDTVTMTDKITSVSLSKQDIAGNELKGAKITVTSKNSFDMSNVKVSGGAEDITVSADSIVFTSGSSDAVITGLAAGDYTMTETTAPSGYLTAESIDFTVNADGSVSVDGSKTDAVVMKDAPVTASLSKETVGGKNLPGAVITVTGKDSSGNTVDFTAIDVTGGASDVSKDSDSLIYTSGSKPAVISKLPAGTYTMHEDTAPLGYSKASDVTFEVNEKGVVTVDGKAVTEVVMIDEVTTGTVVISKRTTSGKGLAGAVIEITSAGSVDFTSPSITVSGDYSNLETTAEKLSFTSGEKDTVIGNLPAGTYTMKEISAPDGYIKSDETITFVVDAEGKVTVDGAVREPVIIENAPVTYEVTVSKTDDSGNALKGASLKLVNNDTGDEYSWISDGTVRTFKLEAGSYTLTEASAPKGYKLAAPISFTVDKDGKEIVMVDVKIVSEVSFSKTDVGGKELPGAKITITPAGGTADLSGVSVTGADDIAVSAGSISFTSSSTPAVIKGLPEGTYKFHEDAAPNGYLVASDIVFDIMADGSVRVDGKTVTEISMIDAEEPYKPVTADVTFSKTDVGGKELPGAKITITSAGGTADLSGVSVTGADDISVSADRVSFTSSSTPAVIKGLPVGTYRFHEDAAPNGYLVANDIEFEVMSDGSVQVGGKTVTEITMVDEKETKPNPPVVVPAAADVTLSKTDVGGNELAGAKITVSGADFTDSSITVSGGGNVVSTTTTSVTYISGSTPTVISGLPEGTYTMHEDAAPAGYKVANDIVFKVTDEGKVTVNGAEVTKITMVDTADVVTPTYPGSGDNSNPPRPADPEGIPGPGFIEPNGFSEPEREDEPTEEDVSSDAGIGMEELFMDFESGKSAGLGATIAIIVVLSAAIVIVRKKSDRRF